MISPGLGVAETQQLNPHCVFRQWLPPSPTALLVIAHGLGEHGGRYHALANCLTSEGIAVFAIDHRGHGLSTGARGHIRHFTTYGEDLNCLIETLHSRYPQLPLHLFGHSMGGLIATGYALRFNNINSLLLSAPAFAVASTAQRLQLKLVPLLALLAPTLQLDNGLDPKAISRDPKVVQAYRDDPLVHSQITPSWARAFIREQQWVTKTIDQLQHPTLMLVAGADSLTKPQTATILFNNIAATRKKLCPYPLAYHEIFNEPEQEQALQELLSWINA